MPVTKSITEVLEELPQDVQQFNGGLYIEKWCRGHPDYECTSDGLRRDHQSAQWDGCLIDSRTERADTNDDQ